MSNTRQQCAKSRLKDNSQMFKKIKCANTMIE